MTKQIIKRNQSQNRAKLKRGSSKPSFKGNLASGINRRAFLRVSSAASFSAFLASCSAGNIEGSSTETSTSESPKPSATVSENQRYFNDQQRAVLETVQQHLLPDDGNGPDAKSINAYLYLEYAMTDEKNIEDGDPEFIAKGIGWLEDLSAQSMGDKFLTLPTEKQATLLERIANSSAGENWLSILMYYLTEALLLDPVYGGNTDQAGWNWLEHQAGFPRPIVGKTYRDFE